MTFDEFKELIEIDQLRYYKILMLSDLGINVTDFDIEYDIIFNNLLNVLYEEDGVTIINWFTRDADYGNMDFTEENEDNLNIKHEHKKYGMFDENFKPICFDIESLYHYTKKYKKATIDIIKNPIIK